MVVIVCFQSQRIVCSKSSGSERRIEWTYLPNTLPRWRLVLQSRFFCWLTLKPDNNFTLWPGFMPVSHTIIPSNRLWAPKLSKHFCVLRFAMQTCWPMSKLIDGGDETRREERERGREGSPSGRISGQFLSCSKRVVFWALKGTSTTSTWITRGELSSILPQCGHKVAFPMGKRFVWHLDNRYSYNSISRFQFFAFFMGNTL